MSPVMLATDGSPAAEAATKTAIELAAALEAPLMAVCCWNVSYEGVSLGFTPLVPDLDRIGKERAEEAVAAATERARAAGVVAFPFVRRGDPVYELCAIASERDARLIVLGTHGWGALRRLMFGSVSTGVLHHANVPVLVVPSRAVAHQANGREVQADVGGRR